MSRRLRDGVKGGIYSRSRQIFNSSSVSAPFLQTKISPIIDQPRRDSIINIRRSSCNVLFLSHFKKISKCHQVTVKNLNPKFYKKIRPVGVALLHAGRRTDGHDMVNSSFSHMFCQRA